MGMAVQLDMNNMPFYNIDNNQAVLISYGAQSLKLPHGRTMQCCHIQTSDWAERITPCQRSADHADR